MNKILKSFLLIFPIFFITIFLVTWGLPHAYFEQDEWGAFAVTINSYNLPWWSFFASKGVHFVPLGILIWDVLYKVFGFQAQYYYLIELFIHASISVFVFILSNRLTNNKMIALIASILFLLNGRASQAFTHLAIFNSTDMAMFFIMLFFIYLSGIREKTFSVKNILVLLLTFFVAISFREEGFIIIPVFIAYLLVFGKSKLNKENIKRFYLSITGVVIILLVRLFAQSLNTIVLPVSQQITGDGAKYNLITIPIKYVVQNLIYSERIVMFLFRNISKIYPDVDFFKSQAPLMDAAFFYIFAFIVCIVAVWLWQLRPKNIGSYIIFFLTWIGANAFMLSFVGRHISVLEPRYLYFSSFPVFCFVAIFMHSLYTSKSKIQIVNLIRKVFVIILFVIFLLTSFQEIRIAVNNQVRNGIAKEKVLKSLHEVHPVLSKNTIFYVKCKDECYRNGEFGISTKNVLPFSSGPGMIILATYSRGYEKEWGSFVDYPFLWGLLDEGYKKNGDRSYGYFTTKGKLEQALLKNNLSKDIVVALEYNEKNFTLRDISESFNKTLNKN